MCYNVGKERRTDMSASKKVKTGIAFGFFIPLHKGHEMMIERAIKENDRAIIAVCGYRTDRGKDFVDYDTRLRLIREIYKDNKNVKVVRMDDKKLGRDGTFARDNWKIWGEELFAQAGEDPTKGDYCWYTGDESFIEKLSAIYPKHRFVLLDRSDVPVSSSEIRENPGASRSLINPRFVEFLEEKGIIPKEYPLDIIITSLLETDLYKFSMGQAIYHQFPGYKTTWTFKCRNKDVHFTPEMVAEIRRQIKAYCTLTFKEDELAYLDSIRWIKGSYVDFLRLWHPLYEDFIIGTDAECGLSIETKGTWLNTSMYEIPTLAIVNEVYFRMAYDHEELMKSFIKRLDDKIEALETGRLNIGSFSEFGLRRRLSAHAEELAVMRLRDAKFKNSTFVGTSNVYLAKRLGVMPVGTMAHEWIMCVGQGNHRHNPAYSNWYALDAWVKEYGILNGTALTDTITTDCFLKDFQLTFGTLFSGVRHDSGDPIVWGEKLIKHYENLGIDPRTKTLLFSDSLNFVKADQIYRHFEGRAKVAFGIGTYIANDTDVPALNIVMKTTVCNGQDVAKVSDTPGKGMCKNPDYVEYLERCIKWRMEHEGAPKAPAFDAAKETENVKRWIKDWFEENGPKASAVIGISGGKDSTIVARLLADSLGKDRVVGVLMPDGVQKDIADAKKVVETLGIRSVVANIGETVKALKAELGTHFELSNDTRINIPPRIRMTCLYAVAQSLPEGGRVANTCNASEDYIGYSTKFGDAAGDFSPCSSFTVTEMLQIGDLLGLPKELVHKTPSDGLSGMTDEDKIGFTYAVLDRYIRTGECDDEATKNKIDKMHSANLHKLQLMPAYKR